MQMALSGLERIYAPGYAYRKASVLLIDQMDLFEREGASVARVMEVMDQINARYGRGTLRLPLDATTGKWRTKQERKSPSYTTKLEDLPLCSLEKLRQKRLQILRLDRTPSPLPVFAYPLY